MGLTAPCLRCILMQHVDIFVILNVNFVNYNVEIGLNINHLSRNTPPYNKAHTGSKPRLLDQVRNRNRLKHYSIRTEQSYIRSKDSYSSITNVILEKWRLRKSVNFRLILQCMTKQLLLLRIKLSTRFCFYIAMFLKRNSACSKMLPGPNGLPDCQGTGCYPSGRIFGLCADGAGGRNYGAGKIC